MWVGALSHSHNTLTESQIVHLIYSNCRFAYWTYERSLWLIDRICRGLTKSRTSLVWIAGPLSGLIMQPVIGALADRSTSKYGRRRPYMVVGSIVVGACLLLLGWTSEVVGLFLSASNPIKKNATLVVAVLAIYLVDFAINAVQACCRSLIVDTLPISQQQHGSAWATRMTGAGSLIGYFIGTLDMGAALAFIVGSGDNQQFKSMTLIAALSLLTAVGVTSWAVTERTLLPSKLASPSQKSDSIFSVLPALLRRTLHLPPRIQAICFVQFWGWIGWFPFLFYSTTWVGETYYRYEHPPDAGVSPSHDALGNIGKLGSLSLVYFSIITFASSIVLPYVVKSPTTTSTNPTLGKFTPRLPRNLPPGLKKLLLHAREAQPDLVTAWLISNLAFAAIMVWAPMVRSVHLATVLIALCGVPWAIGSWAPFAEMGVEINRLASGDTLGQNVNVNGHALGSGRHGYVPAMTNEDHDADLELEDGYGLDRHSSRLSDGVLRLQHEDDEESASTGEHGGAYLGVLNVYTTLPQFVGTFISWVVFSILEPGKEDVEEAGPEHHRWLDVKKDAPNAIAVCLFVGACCAVVAAEATRRLKRIS